MTCKKCGGTGDAWDKYREDWAEPLRDCEHCKGTGETGAGE